MQGLSGLLWILAAAYVLGRSGGKVLGAFLGARWARAAEPVRKYLGLCLFSQAGVAIGLAILAEMRFGEQQIGPVAMGDAIMMIVTATTFVVQLIGPPCVKLAVTKAGEMGLNVTEEDLLYSLRVGDVKDSDVPAFPQDARVSDIMRTVADTEAMHYAVLGKGNRVLGTIAIDRLKQCLADIGMGAWLVAADLAEPVF